jgi:hypothetical protein
MLAPRLTLAICLFVSACVRRPEPTPASDAAAAPSSAERPSETPATNAARRAQASRRPPAGAACAGRDDCTSDQVCVDARCRYRETSVAGEVLASAAEAQGAAGDWAGAIETYDAAFAAFEAKGAPVPPEIACGAAELMLRTATEPDARERGARRADLCFRTTVPGHPARMAVRAALARVRFDGLELSSFDRPEPQDNFFTRSPTRPTVATVAVVIEMPDLEPRELPGHTAVRELLQSDVGRRAIAECFVQDWDAHHRPSASASLRVRATVQTVDLGDRDEYQPHFEVTQGSMAVDGFEPCLAGALPQLFERENRALRRADVWDQVVRVTANVQ